MIRRAAVLWDRVWFAPVSARMFRATRLILALQALWIILSRPDIPSLTSWPAAFFPASERMMYLRFGIVQGTTVFEWPLYALLHLLLILIVAGLRWRAVLFAAGLLLYHFAPFEEIIAGIPHTSFGGLTVSAVGLMLLSFVRQPGAEETSPQDRWPVVLIQLFFTFTYFFAFLAKLRWAGPGWFTASNMQFWALVNYGFSQPPLARALASSTLICWAAAIGTLLFEALSPLAVFSSRFRVLWVAAAVLFHLGIALTLNIAYTSTPLLLLFVDWDRVSDWLRSARSLRRSPVEAGS